MSLTKFSAALNGGKSVMEFLKLGAWKGLVDGNIGQTIFVHGPKGTCVGEDEHGNKYFECPTAQQGRHRYVVYKDLDGKDSSLVPAQWHSWLNYISDEGPHKGEWAKPKFSPAIHAGNPSGTPLKYQPKGSYLNPQRRQWKKVEYWTPN